MQSIDKSEIHVVVDTCDLGTNMLEDHGLIINSNHKSNHPKRVHGL
jgi:hypothetical protein